MNRGRIAATRLKQSAALYTHALDGGRVAKLQLLKVGKQLILALLLRTPFGGWLQHIFSEQRRGRGGQAG